MRRSILLSLIILATFASAPALAGDAPLFGGEGQPPFTPDILPPVPTSR